MKTIFYRFVLYLLIKKTTGFSMKKLKHSKYKNTGILFEMLVRKLTSETMSSDKTVTMSILLKNILVKIQN